MAEESEVSNEQVTAYINDLVSQQFQSLSDDLRRQMAPPAPEPDARARQQREVAEIINPVVEPRLSGAEFRANASQDYSQFYLRNPDALERHDEIEKLFLEAANNGRPMARQAIDDYIAGRDYHRDPGKFREADKERQERELSRARAASDIGMGASGNVRPENTPLGSLEDFAKLSSEEQAKRLSETGLTF